MTYPTMQEHLDANNLTSLDEFYHEANEDFYMNPSADADLEDEIERLEEFIENVSTKFYVSVENEDGDIYLEDISHCDHNLGDFDFTFVDLGSTNHETVNAYEKLESMKEQLARIIGRLGLEADGR